MMKNLLIVSMLMIGSVQAVPTGITKKQYYTALISWCNNHPDQRLQQILGLSEEGPLLEKILQERSPDKSLGGVLNFIVTQEGYQAAIDFCDAQEQEYNQKLEDIQKALEKRVGDSE